MIEVLLPPWIVPEVETHDWLDEGSAVFGAAFAPGIAQRQSYGGLRLKMSRRHTVRGDEKNLLLSILDATRGRYNAMRTKVHFANTGALGFAQLLGNNSFDGTTGWSSSDTGQSVISDAGRILRLRRVAVASTATIRASAVTVVNGAVYAVRAYIAASRGPIRYALTLGSSAGANDYVLGSTISTQQLTTEIATVGGTTAHFSVGDIQTSRSAGDIQDVVYASLARCALVNGASQTGNSLAVDGLPASTDELLAFGDWFEIGGEIKMCTSPLYANSSGEGTLNFEPALVRSPANNAPVMVSDPMGKFLVSNIRVDNRFATQAVVTYDLEHIYE